MPIGSMARGRRRKDNNTVLPPDLPEWKIASYLDDIFQGPEAGLRNMAMTIFDESGVDTLCLSNDVLGQRVDLNGGAAGGGAPSG